MIIFSIKSGMGFLSNGSIIPLCISPCPLSLKSPGSLFQVSDPRGLRVLVTAVSSALLGGECINTKLHSITQDPSHLFPGSFPRNLVKVIGDGGEVTLQPSNARARLLLAETSLPIRVRGAAASAAERNCTRNNFPKRHPTWRCPTVL